MPVQSLNIHLSNAAICSLSCSSEKGRGGGEGEVGARHNQLGTLVTPAVLYGYTRLSVWGKNSEEREGKYTKL